jgi:porin
MVRAAATSASVALVVLSLLPLVAQAAEPSVQTSPAETSAAPEPWLFGDWAGERLRLRDKGFDFQFGYVSEVAYNATGGDRQMVRYADQWTAGVTLDLDKLVGVPDARFQVTFTQRDGRNLSTDARLGTLQQVQEVFGRGQTARLTQFWYQQTFAGDLLDWKIGRMTFGEDFAAFSCDFQNLTFCGANPGNLDGDYIYNWPISQWGTRLKVNIQDFGYVQAGVYDMNPRYLGTADALLPVWFENSTGALLPAEVAWTPTFGDGTLPGSYKVGGWYATASADSVAYDKNGDFFAVSGLRPAQERGRWGAYINFQQQLSERVNVFLNAVWSDERTSFTDRQGAIGLVYTGPFASRPQDDIAFAAGATHVNNKVAKSQRAQNRAGRGPVAVQDTEYAFEVYYTVRPVAGLLFRPNVQYVHRPGGTDKNKDVLVLGLKTSANF